MTSNSLNSPPWTLVTKSESPSECIHWSSTEDHELSFPFSGGSILTDPDDREIEARGLKFLSKVSQLACHWPENCFRFWALSPYLGPPGFTNQPHSLRQKAWRWSQTEQPISHASALLHGDFPRRAWSWASGGQEPSQDSSLVPRLKSQIQGGLAGCLTPAVLITASRQSGWVQTGSMLHAPHLSVLGTEAKAHTC